jgi:DNA (cytosine-5)-methyltransferase 1
MTFLDIFCGAGGLSTGLIQAGWTCAAGVDYCEDELRTFGAAHPGAAPILLDLIGDQNAPATVAGIARAFGVSAVVGGPPCPDFSVAGNGAGKDGERNGFPAFLAVVRIARPRVVLFENVPGLIQSHGDYFETILADLRGMGYGLSVWNLNAADYGVPQKRRRVFVVGIQGARWELTPPKPTHSENQTPLFDSRRPWRGWGEVVDLSIPCTQPPTKVVRRHVEKWIAARGGLSRVLVHNEKASADCAVVPSGEPSHTVRGSKSTAGAVLVSASWEDHRVAEGGDPSGTITGDRGGRHVLVSGKNGSDVFAPPVSPDREPSLTMTPHHDDKLCVDLAALRMRHLTAAELAALQGFPENYPFKGVLTAQRRQIGNAVCPPVAKAIGERIGEALR